MGRITRLDSGEGSGATGSLKGTTKRGHVKSSQGEKLTVRQEGERWHNWQRHAVCIFAVMHELADVNL